MRLFKGLLANSTDQDLITRYKDSGNLDYLAALYNRYLHLIFNVALNYVKVKEDAEDISIEIFQLLQEKLPAQEIANFGGWLHTVTKNHCLMHLRSMSRVRQKEIDFAEFMEIGHDEHHANEVDLEKDLKKLEDCINKLVKEQRKCVELFYKQEKCYKEVANLTGYELKKVKSYLQNGKRNLTICMEG
jgi:RNA polymerase sigma factor (sigma-70 family)